MTSIHGSEIREDHSAHSVHVADPQRRKALASELARAIRGTSFSELATVTFEQRGAELIGEVFLDSLMQSGYSLDDFDAVGALTSAATPIVDSLVHAAAARGLTLNAFVMDFVFPSIKGPSIAGKRVLLIDSWLGEKSYIQTSSLVTLRHGNELGLDFGIIDAEGGKVVAIATLIGSRQGTEKQCEISVVNPVSQTKTQLPFIVVFDEQALRALPVNDAKDPIA